MHMLQQFLRVLLYLRPELGIPALHGARAFEHPSCRQACDVLLLWRPLVGLGRATAALTLERLAERARGRQGKVVIVVAETLVIALKSLHEALRAARWRRPLCVSYGWPALSEWLISSALIGAWRAPVKFARRAVVALGIAAPVILRLITLAKTPLIGAASAVVSESIARMVALVAIAAIVVRMITLVAIAAIVVRPALITLRPVVTGSIRGGRSARR
jgi:hypothetical protein